MIEIVSTNYVSDEARFIREEVFMKEQGFQEEFDEIDLKAVCMVLYDDGKPIACCRYFPGEETGEYIAGRLAVLKEYRGRNLGRQMLEEIERKVKESGGKKISLSAQVRVKGFYETLGYIKSGDIYFDEDCEHIHMEKSL